MSDNVNYLKDPFFELRVQETINNERRANSVFAIIFSLVSLAYSLAICDWFTVTLSLGLIGIVKTYYYLAIRSFKLKSFEADKLHE